MKKMNGFSLVQVLVAIALMGGLSLLIMKISQQGSKAQVTITTNGQIEDFYNRVRMVLY